MPVCAAANEKKNKKQNPGVTGVDKHICTRSGSSFSSVLTRVRHIKDIAMDVCWATMIMISKKSRNTYRYLQCYISCFQVYFIPRKKNLHIDLRQSFSVYGLGETSTDALVCGNGE